MTTPVILWFRQDLRLADNAALLAAVAQGPVVPVYIFDESVGAAQQWWLHHSLSALADDLRARGAALILRRGDFAPVLRAVMAETGATRIHATRLYEPHWKAADATLADALVLHDGNHLMPPAALRTGSGGRFKIFTPYWRALLQQMPPPLPAKTPERIEGRATATEQLQDWALRPTAPDWSKGFDIWKPGEAGARAALKAFLPAVADYHHARNLPSVAGSSRLSPHLHFGEISPATVWHHVAKRVGEKGAPYLRELGWRDYAANAIDQFPDYGRASARAEYDAIGWRTSAGADADFKAWTKGQTGYPIVDAGMRELWATGWMHNRVRMIAASFLVKHLLIDWRRGERWFWDTLLDADIGSNAVNWQWTAGTGVDSNMFVRIMAPLSQSEKFAAGRYIRRWVPELADVPEPWVHDPHESGQAPRGYAAPLIGHREGRERALAAYGAMKRYS